MTEGDPDQPADGNPMVETLRTEGIGAEMIQLTILFAPTEIEMEARLVINQLKRLEKIEAARNTAAEIIGENALKKTEKYDPNGNNPREYHQRSHSEDVSQDYDTLFNHRTMQNELIQIIRTAQNTLLGQIALYLSMKRAGKLAAKAHDTDQEENPQTVGYAGGNEKRSAASLAREMEGYEFEPPEDIEVEEIRFSNHEMQMAGQGVEGTITGPSTMPVDGAWPNHTYIKQACENPPQIPWGDAAIEWIQRIICDSDLASFGKEWPEYWKNMVAYFRETNREELKKTSPEIDELKKKWTLYLQMQECILDNHVYKTNAAKEIYDNGRIQNQRAIVRVRRKAESIEASFQAMLTKTPFPPPSIVPEVSD